MTPIGPLARARVLKVASQVTSDRGSAMAIAVNASPLLAWLESATDEGDLQLRWQAMRQQYLNVLGEPGDDDPERFLAQARTLYAFLTAGPAEEPANDSSPGDLHEKLRRLGGLFGQESS